MSSLARRFFVFVGVVCVLFGAVFVSFRCGHSRGLKDAPRHYYSVDVAYALNNNPAFRTYVDSLYVSTYRSYLDSSLRTDRIAGLVSNWLKDHPGCSIGGVKRPSVKPKASDFERLFFKGGR